MLEVFNKAFGWLVAYVLAIVVPTMLFLGGDIPEGRGFWIEFGVLLGFGLLLIIVWQFLLTARFRGVAYPFGVDVILQFHRHAGILVLLFLIGHPLILIVKDPEYLKYFDPRENAPRAIFLILASIAMVLLVVLSLWRTAFGLNYEWWRLTHGLMAAGVVVVGIAHPWQVEHYVAGWPKRGLLVLLGGSALAMFAYVRLYRPWRMRKKPYRISEVREERGESTTVALEPVGHEGMKFRGGQYAWLTIGKTPFTLQQNPYSFSASDTLSPGRLEFTAKELGDFSRELADVSVGTKAFLEGPYGTFCLEDDARGAVMIMGGIGVTPGMSILRSARDRGDRRPFLLIYANGKWEETAFRKELKSLEEDLNLKVVHVLTDPPEGWEGETGYVDRDLLEKYIGEEERKYSYFVCGPVPMMDAVEPVLLEVGVPLHRTRAERFNMV